MRGSKPKIVGQYRTVKELGRGAYGQVFLCQHLQTAETRALKALHQIDLMGVDAQKKAIAKRHLDTEIRAMREIKSEHVVRLYDVLSTKRRMYLVMEYCDGGSLSSKLQETDRMPFEEAARYFRELASALISMHANSFIHRDLKPDNVLLHKNTIKLGDFGLSKKVTERTLARSVVGTRLFMSPEVLHNIDNSQLVAYNARADYWSIGIILYQMVTGKVLFNSKMEFELKEDQKKVCADREIITKIVAPQECKDLLARLIVYDSNHRISPEEFCSHPFVTGVPLLSQVDFYSLVCFSKPPIFTLVPFVALRLAALLESWAEDSESAFVFYLKACRALSLHTEKHADCQTFFGKLIKLADSKKTLTAGICPTLIITERVAVYCGDVRRSDKSDVEKASNYRESWLLLDLVKPYPEVVAFKRRLEKAIERLV